MGNKIPMQLLSIAETPTEYNEEDSILYRGKERKDGDHKWK